MRAEASILTRSGEEIALLEEFRLSYTQRLNDVSSAQIEVPGHVDFRVPDRALLGVRLLPDRGDSPVEYDFIGPLRKRKVTGGAYGLKAYPLEAQSMESWLIRRRIRPTGYNPPTTLGTYDTRSGNADVALKGYWRAALTGSWAVPGLSVEADKNEGNVLTWEGRLDELLDASQKIAAAGEVDFRVVWLGGGSWQLRTYYPYMGRDLTVGNGSNPEVLLSESFGTLGEWDWESDEYDVRNHLIVAGAGDLGARKNLVVEDPASIVQYGLSVDLVDANGDTEAKLRAEGLATLRSTKRSTDSYSAELAGEVYEYLVDYELGALVTVDLPPTAYFPHGRRLTNQVVEVEITAEAEKEVTVKPTVGVPPPSWARRLRGIERRVGRVAKR